jgi:hypothetical protein
MKENRGEYERKDRKKYQNKLSSFVRAVLAQHSHLLVYRFIIKQKIKLKNVK